MSTRTTHRKGMAVLLSVGSMLAAMLMVIPAVAAAGPVQDGGFEIGRPNPYWSEYSDNSLDLIWSGCSQPSGCGFGAHTGDWWVWFGGVDIKESGSVSQSVVIPTGSATLRFFLWIETASVISRIDVYVDGDSVFEATEVDQGAYDTYTEVSVDISAYADGGFHTLSFASAKAGGGPANYFLDDVSITLGAAPTTGTVTGTVRYDGAPLAGVEVWLGYDARYACTESDGTFAFTDVPTGETLVAATGPAYGLPCSNPSFLDSQGRPLGTQFWDHKRPNEGPNEFTVAAGETKVIDFDVLLRQAPVAVADTASVANAGLVKIDVIANDSNPEGEALEVIKVSGPSHGTAVWSLADGGKFVYQHDGSNTTTDSFTYKLADTVMESAPATVTISIAALPVVLPPAPVAPTVGLQDPTTGQWHLRDASGAVTTFYYGNPGDVAFVGDWDCNGTDTPGLFRTSDAYAYLRNANTQGNANTRFFFGNPSDIPLAGDFDGDGCDTLSIYRPSEQRFFIMNKLGANEGGLGAAEYSFVFGNPGDKPVVGDWDGDGVDEIGLHRESSGFFYYRNSLTQGNADGQFYFGDPGDRFVAGDWGNVDVKDTPAVFRPSNNTFYFRHTLTAGNADSSINWGQNAFVPVAGNYGALPGGGGWVVPPPVVTPPPPGAHPTSGAGWRILECSTDVETSVYSTSGACARIRVQASAIPAAYKTCTYDPFKPPNCIYHDQHTMKWHGPNGPILAWSETKLYDLGSGMVVLIDFKTTIHGRGLPAGEYRAEFCRTQYPNTSTCVQNLFTVYFTIQN